MVLFIATGIVLFTTCKSQKEIARQTEGVVRGYVYAEVSDKEKKIEQLFLPGIKVAIKDEKSNTVDEVITKPDGSYSTKHLKFGKYKICLSKEGFAQSCYDVDIEYGANHPGPLKINLKDENYIWGTAKLKDGNPGYFSNPYFGVEISTEVNLKTASLTAKTLCNTSGYYLFVGVNPTDAGTLIATCQKAMTTGKLGGSRKIDLTFMNSNPSINYIVGLNEKGKALLRTRPGNKLKVIADVIDAEKNRLYYKWIPSVKNNSIILSDSSSIDWKLPNSIGRYEMTLLVYDSMGGVAYKTYSINAGDGSVDFAGIISDAGGSERMSKTAITVNGKYAATTDEKGYYRFKVPENDSDRYVLNIDKPGYVLCSKVYATDAVQKDYRLLKATTQSFDPKQDINLAEAEDTYTKFNKKNGAGEVRNAVRVSIPANSIVDSTGNLVTVPVNVSIRSIDLADNYGFLPGNNECLRNGVKMRMKSYTAADVQVRDKANPSIKYQLANDKKAMLYMPVTASQFKALPNKIAAWKFNHLPALWQPLGSFDKAGTIFQFSISEFGGIDFGEILPPQQLASPTSILLQDGSNSIFSKPGTVTIRLFMPQPLGGLDQGTIVANLNSPADLQLGNLLPIENLPENTVVTIQVIQNGVVINTLNPRTGQNAGPTSQNPFGGFGLGNSFVPAGSITILMLPDIAAISQPQLDEFLNHVSNNQPADVTADKYYELIGAYSYTTAANTTPHHITFAEWKEKNGYVNGLGDENSIYYNAGDLGFWRGMHKKTFNGITSYYVSNFKTDNDAILNQFAFATVCMEYSTMVVGGAGVPVTKFYVFKGEPLANSANLDNNINNGEKYVPGLCITCHGGSASVDYASFANATDLQTYFNGHTNEIPTFLPFDLKSFFYSTATGFTRADQEENLRKLNNDLKITNPTKAIVDFINVSYTNQSGTAGQKFDDNATVDIGGADTWKTSTLVNGVSPEHFYVDVVGPSCRTCHIARTDNPRLWFDTKAKFIAKKSSILFAVKGSGGTSTMPNAKETYLKFWQSQAPQKYVELGKLLFNDGSTFPPR